MADDRRASPAVERNREPILSILSQILPSCGLVLEIASGTGEHAAFFARALPHLTWQPSDPDLAMRASIIAWTAEAALPNLRPPLDIDARHPEWPITTAGAVLCINMVHISPWSATLGLMAGASQILPKDGPLVLYGPYKRQGRHTASSNEVFDQSLRARNPDWGVRDLEIVVEAAEARGHRLEDICQMPANNLIVVFRRGE